MVNDDARQVNFNNFYSNYILFINFSLGLKSSDKWHCIDACVVPDILRNPSAFISKGEKETLLAFQTWETSQPTAQFHIIEELDLQLLCCEEFENRTKQKQLFLFDYKVPEEKWDLISNLTVFEKVVLFYLMLSY